jgi:hypothetical protein
MFIYSNIYKPINTTKKKNVPPQFGHSFGEMKKRGTRYKIGHARRVSIGM